MGASVLRQRAQADLVDFQGCCAVRLMARFARAKTGTVSGCRMRAQGAQLFYDRIVEGAGRRRMRSTVIWRWCGRGAQGRPAAEPKPVETARCSNGRCEGRWPQTCLVQSPFILIHPFGTRRGQSFPRTTSSSFATLCAGADCAGRGVHSRHPADGPRRRYGHLTRSPNDRADPKATFCDQR